MKIAKITLLLSLVLVFMLAFSSCGNQDEIDEMKNRIEVLEQENEALKSELEDLKNNSSTDGESNDVYADALDFYPLPDGTYGVMAGNALYMEKVVIPAEYNGKPVTQILPNAFSRATNLIEITIPNSVTSIGYWAFSGCSSLESVVIGDSVTSIGDYAFYGCSSLTSVVIGDSVTSIEGSAFSSCKSLTSVVIPDSVTSIGEWAFDYCYKLVEVINHSSLNIKKGSSNHGCVGLYAIEVHNEGNSKIDNINNYLFYSHNEKNYLIGYEGNDKDLILPENYKEHEYEIYTYAFSHHSDIKSILIPDSVTSIGSYAFNSCSSLVSIVIPDSVTRIGSSAFSGCSSLESITLPFIGESRKTSSDTYQYPIGYIFGTGGYEGGVGTTQYYYGSSTSSTTSNEFFIPENLKNITVTGGEILYGAFGNCENLTSVVIPDSVTSIGDHAFNRCSNLTNVVIGDSVTSIGVQAFYGCSSLTSIVIPDSVTSIGYWAFSYCSNLTSVVIGNSVTSIGDSAFYNCSNLTNVVIGDSVTSIGYRAFEYCSSLKDVYITNLSTWCNIKFGNNSANPLCSSYLSKNLYLNNELITELVIPDDVTSIGDYAFYDCDSITSVVIPDNVTTIGNHAFYGCSSLTSVVIGDSVTYIGQYAFNCCDNLTCAEFKDPNGWRISGMYPLTSSELSDTSTAAQYLRSNYCYYTWIKE